MKSYFVLLLIALSQPVFADTIRLSEPVVQTDKTETFGSEVNTRLPEVTLATLTSNPDTYLEQPFLLKTRVAKVCQKKGCFFIAQQGNDIIRVSFKDYGFFIPTDSSDKTVTLTGQLVKKMMSEAQAAHFRQDINDENTSLKAGEVYEIVADSVRIPKHS